MKVKRYLPILLSVTASTFVLSGCSDWNNGFEPNRISFDKNFKEAFGVIDPQQDFNVATRGFVNVATQKDSEIKIYAKIGDAYKLVGDYEKVNGSRQLEFDIAEGTTEIMVSNGNYAEKTIVGGSVNMIQHQTRAAFSSDIAQQTNTWKEMDETLVKAWAEIIPELGDRSNAKTYGTNLGKVTMDFTYTSTGRFVIYPMYCCTSSANTLGIYYTDATGAYHEIDIWSASNFPTDSEGNTEVQYKRKLNESSQDDTQTWRNVSSTNAMYGLADKRSQGGDKNLDNIYAVRSKGIEVNLPLGTVFGMYIRHSSGVKFYSESALNPDVSITETYNGATYDIETDLTKKACHASTFYVENNSNKYMFLGFEDWTNDFNGGGNSDFDLNDMMFLIDGVLPAVQDEQAPGWILAYEDLGNSLDWDYNDIVLKIQHVSGQGKAYATPLAAVGTLASYVKYDGNYITGDKNTSEIHQWFGDEETTSGNYAIHNGYSKGSPAKQVEFTVPESFTMTTLGTVDQMGGLTIEVENPEATGSVAVISYVGAGNVPEVICLPDYWRRDNDDYAYEWAWPLESTHIEDVYPRFSQWVSDKNAATDWYKDAPSSGSVSGSFKHKVSTGSINSSANPQPLVALHSSMYIAQNTTVSFADMYSSVGSDGAITMSSSNTTVATINQADKTVYGATVGKTTITIEQKAGVDSNGKQWPSCIITFDVYVANTNNMSVTPTSTNLMIGDTKQITITTQSAGDITYSGYDNNIINVNAEGLITAVGLGTTTITVSQAGTDTYMPASQTITVKVTNAPSSHTLTYTSQPTINWSEFAYYKITGNEEWFNAGAVIEFEFNAGGYADVCLSGTSTTWSQVGKPDAQTADSKEGKIILTQDQANTIKTNGGFYAVVWGADITSIKITPAVE